MTSTSASMLYTDEELARMDAALDTLGELFARLQDLPMEVRRGLAKMGPKSEGFCRQVYGALMQNPEMLPPHCKLADLRLDLDFLEQIRPRALRLHQFAGRADDSETAAGSRLMSASLAGYKMFKTFGKGSGIEGLQDELAYRFRCQGRSKPEPEKNEE